jgi:uncharacterized protein (UPF0261 family)
LIFLVGTYDTKAEELTYLHKRLCDGAIPVRRVDVGTRASCAIPDVTASEVASFHPDGPDAVLGLDDRGQAVAAMAEAFARYCVTERQIITAVLGIGGGGGTSIISTGMQTLAYGIPKVMVSTLASGDVAPYVGTSDIIMMPSITDIAGLNRISRHILHNAAEAVKGMAATPHVPPKTAKPSIGLSMFGVTTPSVMQITARLKGTFDCVTLHATGTGGRIMENLLADGMLEGVIDITTTEIADELVGGVLSAGPTRLDAVISSGKPYVGSVGALDMVNFWAPETVPDRFRDRLFYHHNANVTLMRTTAQENTRIGNWIAAKLNAAVGPVCVLLPEKGISALDIDGGPFWDPAADGALFDAIEGTLEQNDTCQLRRLPFHINDPDFSAAAADAFKHLS